MLAWDVCNWLIHNPLRTTAHTDGRSRASLNAPNW